MISEADGDSIKVTPESSYLWDWHVYIRGHGQRFCKALTTTIKRINNDIISLAPVLKINTMSSCGDPFVADQRSPTEVAPVYPHWHLFVSISNIISNKLLTKKSIFNFNCKTNKKWLLSIHIDTFVLISNIISNKLLRKKSIINFNCKTNKKWLGSIHSDTLINSFLCLVPVKFMIGS